MRTVRASSSNGVGTLVARELDGASWRVGAAGVGREHDVIGGELAEPSAKAGRRLRLVPDVARKYDIDIG